MRRLVERDADGETYRIRLAPRSVLTEVTADRFADSLARRISAELRAYRSGRAEAVPTVAARTERGSEPGSIASSRDALRRAWVDDDMLDRSQLAAADAASPSVAAASLSSSLGSAHAGSPLAVTVDYGVVAAAAVSPGAPGAQLAPTPLSSSSASSFVGAWQPATARQAALQAGGLASDTTPYAVDASPVLRAPGPGPARASPSVLDDVLGAPLRASPLAWPSRAAGGGGGGGARSLGPALAKATVVVGSPVTGDRGPLTSVLFAAPRAPSDAVGGAASTVPASPIVVEAGAAAGAGVAQSPVEVAWGSTVANTEPSGRRRHGGDDGNDAAASGAALTCQSSPARPAAHSPVRQAASGEPGPPDSALVDESAATRSGVCVDAAADAPARPAEPFGPACVESAVEGTGAPRSEPHLSIIADIDDVPRDGDDAGCASAAGVVAPVLDTGSPRSVTRHDAPPCADASASPRSVPPASPHPDSSVANSRAAADDAQNSLDLDGFHTPRSDSPDASSSPSSSSPSSSSSSSSSSFITMASSVADADSSRVSPESPALGPSTRTRTGAAAGAVGAAPSSTERPASPPFSPPLSALAPQPPPPPPPLQAATCVSGARAGVEGCAPTPRSGSPATAGVAATSRPAAVADRSSGLTCAVAPPLLAPASLPTLLHRPPSPPRHGLPRPQPTRQRAAQPAATTADPCAATAAAAAAPLPAVAATRQAVSPRRAKPSRPRAARGCVPARLDGAEAGSPSLVAPSPAGGVAAAAAGAPAAVCVLASDAFDQSRATGTAASCAPLWAGGTRGVSDTASHALGAAARDAPPRTDDLPTDATARRGGAGRAAGTDSRHSRRAGQSQSTRPPPPAPGIIAAATAAPPPATAALTPAALPSFDLLPRGHATATPVAAGAPTTAASCCGTAVYREYVVRKSVTPLPAWLGGEAGGCSPRRVGGDDGARPTARARGAAAAAAGAAVSCPSATAAFFAACATSLARAAYVAAVESRGSAADRRRAAWEALAATERIAFEVEVDGDVRLLETPAPLRLAVLTRRRGGPWRACGGGMDPPCTPSGRPLVPAVRRCELLARAPSDRACGCCRARVPAEVAAVRYFARFTVEGADLALRMARQLLSAELQYRPLPASRRHT